MTDERQRSESSVLGGLLSGSTLRRRLLSGSIWAVAGRFGGSLISILTASLLTFVISPEEVGAYNLVLTIVAFGALVGALGLPKTVVRLVAENMGLNRSGRTRRVIYTVLGLGVAGTLLTSLAYYLVIGDIVEGRLFDSPLLLGLTGLIAVWIAIAIVQEITAETFRGFHDLRWATLLGGLATGGKSGGLIMRLMLLACLALLWSTGAGVDLKTVMVVSIGAGSVSLLLSCWLLYGKVSSLGSGATEEEPVNTREVLDDALPFLAIAMTTFVLQSADIWILGALDSTTAVAVYTNASKLVTFVVMPLLVVNLVMPPIVAEMYSQGREARGRLVRLLRSRAPVHGPPGVDAAGQPAHQPTLLHLGHTRRHALRTRRSGRRSSPDHKPTERANGAPRQEGDRDVDPRELLPLPVSEGPDEEGRTPSPVECPAD